MAGVLTVAIAAAFAGGVTPDPYYEYTTLLLPGNGTNGANNNTFLDGSTNNFTITRNGNTTQGTFSPFSQTGWGNYFSGSQSISIAATASLQYSGDFTIECWFYKNATGDATTFIQQSGSNYFAMNVNPGTGINIYLNNASANFIITDRVPQPNTWHHIALVRSGSASGNIKCYLDGVASTTTATNTSTLGYNAIGYLGAIGTASGGSFVGYISNFRIASGRAVYTSNFTPPTTPLTRTTGGTNPPQGSETIWLTAQSNRFLDSDGVNTPASSPLTITVNGSPSVQAFSPFNPTSSWSAATYGGSGYFDGNGDYLTVGSASDWTFLHNGSSWTVQFDLFYSSTSAQAIVSTNNATGDVGILIDINNAGANQLRVAFYRGVSGSSAIFSSNAALVINAWNIVSITFESSTKTCSFYVNGVAQGSSANTGFAYSASAPDFTLGIGRAQGATPGLSFTGYISNLRISNSVRTGLTTLPTSPFTSDANTSLLLNYTNVGIYDATSKNDLETVGNAQISTTQSKWGGSSMYFDGTGDWLLIPDQPIQRIGTGNFTIEMWVYRNSSGPHGLAGKGTGTTGWLVSLNSSNQVVFIYGSNNITSSGTVSATTWTHIAVVREGTSTNQTKIYINGTNDGTGTVSTDFNQTNSMYVGADRTGGSSANAYMQDVRVTNYARYTANFTAPTAPFPTF